MELGRAPPRLQIALSSEDNRHKVGLFTVGGRNVNPLEAALQHLVLGSGGGLSDETSHLGVRYASRSDLAPRIDAKTELRRRRWQWRRWHCTCWQRRPWHCLRWQRRRWHCLRCCSAAGAMLWARLPLRFRPLTIAAEKFAGHAELILVNDALSRPHARSRWCWTGALQPAPRGWRGRHHAHFPGQPADKRAAECDGYFVRSARCGLSISSRGFRIRLSPTWCMGCE